MRRQIYIEAFGQRYRRAVCARCGHFCTTLGEAVRVDLAEGGFTVAYSCLNCLRRSRLRAVRAGGREALAA